MKPQFDPSKPFEPVGKPAFDPSKPFEPVEDQKLPSRPGEAALQGFGQAGTFGYLPNIQAAAQKVTDPLFSAITGQDVEPESYVEARDKLKKRDEGLLESNPGSYMAGQVAGSLATPVPGSGLIKGAGVAKAAARGALGSAIYNPGETEGEISGLQLGDRAKQAAVGGLIGGGLEKTGQVLKSMAPKFKSASNFLTTSAIGAQKGDFKRLLRKDELDEVAEFARKHGLGKNLESAYVKSQEMLDDAGPKISQIYKSAQAQVNDPNFLKSLKPEQAKTLLDSELMPKKIAKEIYEDLSKEWTGKAGGKQVLNRVATELDELKGLGKVTDIDQLLKFRRSVDDLINFDKPIKDMAGGQEALASIRRAVQKKIDNRIDALDKVVGGDSLKALKDLNRTYKNASTIQKISQAAKAGDEAKMALGLPELIAGGALGAGSAVYNQDSGPESIAKGLLGAVALKGARKFGPGLAAPVIGAMSRPAEAVGGFLQSPATQRVIDRSRR